MRRRRRSRPSLSTSAFRCGPISAAAIEKVEEALGNGQREMLVAMATGTGKTKLAIALLYRLLNVKRFRRVCFVVDRNALGEQAAGEFRTTKVVGPRAFADIFDLKGLADISPEPETKVHICTIQGLVKRVALRRRARRDVPPIDQYDLMVDRRVPPRLSARPRAVGRRAVASAPRTTTSPNTGACWSISMR